jgi:4-carboxymuconolactone decarboxylase
MLLITMRLEKIDPENWTERQREIGERIAGRRGAVRGPFQVWIQSPDACERVEALGAYVRFESNLPLRLRELSLLIAARHFDAQYSWNAHVDRTVDSGIPRSAVEAIARREVPVFDNAEDSIFFDFCDELLTNHFVSDETFSLALECFGPAGLVDAVASLGNYTMLGMCLNAFQVDLQPDREPPFPDVRGYAKVGTTET